MIVGEAGSCRGAGSSRKHGLVNSSLMNSVVVLGGNAGAVDWAFASTEQNLFHVARVEKCLRYCVASLVLNAT